MNQKKFVFKNFIILIQLFIVIGLIEEEEIFIIIFYLKKDINMEEIQKIKNVFIKNLKRKRVDNYEFLCMQ